MPPSSESVGFIGLGNMGRPMAASLARSGFEVIGYDADSAASAAFAGETGCRTAPTLAALADAATIAGNMKARWAEVNAALGRDADFTRAISHEEPE